MSEQEGPVRPAGLWLDSLLVRKTRYIVFSIPQRGAKRWTYLHQEVCIHKRSVTKIKAHKPH